jgi:hypothetical protein
MFISSMRFATSSKGPFQRDLASRAAERRSAGRSAYLRLPGTQSLAILLSVEAEAGSLGRWPRRRDLGPVGDPATEGCAGRGWRRDSQVHGAGELRGRNARSGSEADAAPAAGLQSDAYVRRAALAQDGDRNFAIVLTRLRSTDKGKAGKRDEQSGPDPDGTPDHVFFTRSTGRR